MWKKGGERGSEDGKEVLKGENDKYKKLVNN
jgi:hypothetical protein